MSGLSSDGRPADSSPSPGLHGSPGRLTRAPVVGSPPLVEREQTIIRLCHHLDAALAGRGRLVLLAGEAGIGKTTLAVIAREEAVARGALVLAGTCYDLTDTQPYGPWSDLFAAYRPTGELPPPPAAFATSGGLERAESQAVIVDHVRGFLEAVSTRRPLLVLLEDLHWADPASLDMLWAVSRWISHLPVLLLATYRHDEVTRRHRLRQLLPLLTREAEGERIELQRLSITGLTALVVERYQLDGDESARLARFLHQRAGGNAFYTVQLLRTLEETGGLRLTAAGWTIEDLGQAPVPATLRDDVDARVLRLDPTAQDQLELAAVIGQEVSVTLWAAVAGCPEEELLSVVDTASTARLIEATPDGGGIFFLHALVREALYDSVLPLRRRHLHRRVAAALLAMSDPDPDGLAYHLRQAGDPRAADWLVRAGDRAERSYAMATAIARFEAALALLDATGGASGIRATLRFRLSLLRRFQDPYGGVTMLNEAQALAEDAGDRALAARIILLRGMLRGHANSRLDEAIRELRLGVAALDAVPVGGDAPAIAEERYAAYLNRGMLIMWLAMVGCYTEARNEGTRYLETIRAPSESLEAATQTVAAWTGLSLAYAALGEIERARQATAASRIASETLLRHRLLAPSVHSNYARLAFTYAADDPAERRRLQAESDFFSKRNQTHQVIVDERFLGRSPELPLLFAMGKWDEARGLAATFVDAYGTGPVGEAGRETIGAIAHAQGDTELAWRTVRDIWLDGPAVEPGPRFVLPALGVMRLAVMLALDEGDLGTAQNWLAAHDRWLAWTSTVPGRSEGHALWAMWHHRDGHLRRALETARHALDDATTPRQPLAMLGAHRLLAALAAEHGQLAVARQHLVQAQALATACEAPYEMALTRLVGSQIYVASGDVAVAKAMLAEVRAICEPIGARRALAQADRLVDQLDGAASHRDVRPDGLSSREAEILRLLAGGLSNQAIADTLSLSVRTIERHLTNAYAKIDAPGRTAAVAYALRHLA